MNISKFVKLVVMALSLNLVAFSSQAALIGVDFSGTLVQYQGQYSNGSHSVDALTNTLTMDGNNWVALAGPFVIKANTVIQITFNSDNVGEIHGIGFDTNSVFNRNTDMTGKRFFQIAGSQTYGIQDYNTFGESGMQLFTIEAGKYFTGKFNNLILANDLDIEGSAANSVYSYSVSLFEVEAANISEPALLLLVGLAGLFVVRQKAAKR